MPRTPSRVSTLLLAATEAVDEYTPLSFIIKGVTGLRAVDIEATAVEAPDCNYRG
jgi:hypothetical protein